MIENVRAGSPAEKAGLVPMDMLVELGGAALSSYKDLRNALKDLRIGDRVKVVVLREGNKMVFILVLKER